MHRILQSMNRGEPMQKPFRFDWRDAPTSIYNLCIENYFSSDFWASVDGGQYDANLIPQYYRTTEAFSKLYRRHIVHLRKCWATQQHPPSETQRAEKAKHYARNSRIGTVGVLHTRCTFPDRADMILMSDLP